MYRKDTAQKANPKSGCPITANIAPNTFNRTTGTINNIHILSVNIPYSYVFAHICQVRGPYKKHISTTIQGGVPQI